MTNEEIKTCLNFLEEEYKKVGNINLNFKDSVLLLQTDLKFMLKKNLMKEGVTYGKA